MDRNLEQFIAQDLTEEDFREYQEFWAGVRERQREKTMAVQKADEIMTNHLGWSPFKGEIV